VLKLLQAEFDQERGLREPGFLYQAEELLLGSREAARANAREDVREILLSERQEECVESRHRQHPWLWRGRRRLGRWRHNVTVGRQVRDHALDQLVLRAAYPDRQVTAHISQLRDS